MPAPPPRRLFVPRLGLVCLVMAIAGCDTPASKPAVVAEPPPTPEERFDSLVQTLKRQIENGALDGINAGRDYNAPAGTPVTKARVRITHELTPPVTDGEPYRGVVCFVTKSKVTVVLAQPTEEESAEADAKRKAKRAELETDLEGVPDLDMLVAPSANRLAASPIHEIEPDETNSCFEFEYRDGLWRLVSELDRDNEPFYAIAIEFALKRQ